MELSSSTSPVCSTESSASGPSHDLLNSSVSEVEESEDLEAVSLLSKLRAPRPSDLSRRRKIAANPPCGKRKSRSYGTDLKTIKPEKRVRENPNEPLTVSSGKLFCRGCREELCLKSSSLKNHLSSTKHLEGKKRLDTKEAREQDISQALRKYNECHPRGETLPESQQVYRVKVVRTFLQAGVPLSKLSDFRDLLEENGYRLSDRRFMFDLVPFILKEEETCLKQELRGKQVGVIFDGTTRLGEALAIILRFVSESWTLEQRLVRIQLLSKSMTGEEIARELIHVLSATYTIGHDQLIAAMRDRAAVNGVAMRTLTVVYPKLLDVGCFSHTIDRVGEHFKTPVLSEFSTSWIMLFSHSPKAKLLWREQTGRAMISYSATRWWSRWEVFHQLLVQFGDVELFLQRNDLATASRQKLLTFFQDPQKTALLNIELASIIDWGEAFVKATYNLEGDGPLAFTCYEIVQTIVASIQVANTPNVSAVAKCLAPAVPAAEQQLVTYAKSCVQPGLDYFQHQLQTSLKVPLAAFKAARLFCPSKVSSIKPSASEVDTLLAFPFLLSAHLADLKGELPAYLAKADGVDPTFNCLEWWKQNTTSLPAWATAAKKVLVTQPSSAAAERAFSLLNSTFGDNQDNSLKDYIETSVMLRYNKRSD